MGVGKEIYCVDESVYSEHISKRKKYVVEDYQQGQIRTKNNNDKLVWLPELCFTQNEVPEIVSIKIDNRIDDPKNDCVDVTVEFSDGEKFWITFITYVYVNILLQANKYLILANFIIVEEINEISINEIVTELDRKNELKQIVKVF